MRSHSATARHPTCVSCLLTHRVGHAVQVGFNSSTHIRGATVCTGTLRRLRILGFSFVLLVLCAFAPAFVVTLVQIAEPFWIFNGIPLVSEFIDDLD